MSSEWNEEQRCYPSEPLGEKYWFRTEIRKEIEWCEQLQ